MKLSRDCLSHVYSFVSWREFFPLTLTCKWVASCSRIGLMRLFLNLSDQLENCSEDEKEAITNGNFCQIPRSFFVRHLYWNCSTRMSFLKRLEKESRITENDKTKLYHLMSQWKKKSIIPTCQERQWIQHLLDEVLYYNTKSINTPTICLRQIMKLPYSDLQFKLGERLYRVQKNRVVESRSPQFYCGLLTLNGIYPTARFAPFLLTQIKKMESDPKYTFCMYSDPQVCPFCGTNIQSNQCTEECAFKCADFGSYIDQVQKYNCTNFITQRYFNNLRPRKKRKVY